MEKGKIIAIGGGFGDDARVTLARRVWELSGKARPRLLHIPTSGYDFPDGGDVSFYYKLGFDTDILYVTHAYMTEALAAQQIRAADVVHVPGGNLRFLAEHWKRAGIEKYLREAYEQGKVMFGSSTGSMCWFRQGYNDCGPLDSFEFIDALGLLPYCNCPHYESAFWQSFNDRVKETPLSSIACENETAVCCIEGEWSLMLSGNRPDARVWFFDAANGYERIDLRLRPDILETL